MGKAIDPKISVSDAMIGWMCNKECRITELIVLSSAHATSDIYNQYDYWEGKGSKGWGEDNFRTTPVGIFAYIASEYGFQSREVAYRALKEFSKIKDQSWARLTRKSMDGELI
ncbi:hypothetical protein MEX01_50510 [Methylorubrum extorquens]|uniref:hypothetical protein n=1 Tax=Methylorubrum extorquens TaxID=408 RepID=UPI00117538B7|nr:hypothetical protein [Methylorubrum extorquens]GEL44460.1 hypothetical protein MEX01_50510 [Methylorubrum extorquens]